MVLWRRHNSFCSKSITKIYAADTIESKEFLQKNYEEMRKLIKLSKEGYDVKEPFFKLLSKTQSVQETLAISLSLEAHKEHVSNGGDANKRFF